MSIGPQTTLPELAFIVCTALNSADVVAVLSGGGAATVYAPDAYQSRDLDFILTFQSAVQAANARPILDLGFSQLGGTYRHPQTDFTVEFPPGPLSVGSDPITSWVTLEDHGQVLHILSPTDCVRDRLAGFLFYNDFSSLEQALVVSARHPVNLEAIRDWALREGEPAKWRVFERRFDRT